MTVENSTSSLESPPKSSRTSDHESTALLPNSDISESSFYGRLNKLSERLYPSGFVSEVKPLLAITLPLTAQAFFVVITIPIGLLFAGSLGVTELAGLALGNSVIAVLVNSVYLGLGSASDCYMSQVVGSGNYRLVGVILQRFLVIFGLVTLVIFALILNIENLLLLIGQDPLIASLAAFFVNICLPGFLFLCLQRILSSFLLSLRIVKPGLIGACLSAIVAVISNFLLVNTFNLGLAGSGLTQILVYMTTGLTLGGYVILKDVTATTWTGWTWLLFKDWGPSFSMALYGMLMVCLELWAFEIALLLSGTLGETELAAQSIVFNLDLFFYAIPISFNLGIGIRVGIALGEGDAKKAWTINNVGITLMLISSAVTTTILGALRFELPKLFTDDPSVIWLSANILPYIAYYNAFFNVACAVKGTLRGAGKQAKAAIVVFIGYYVISLPISVPLMYNTPLRSSALWLGFSIALTFNCIIFIIYVTKYLDYDKLCKEAAERVGRKRLASKVLSQSVQEADINMPTDLKIKRGFTIAAFVGVFILGVLIRIFVPPPPEEDTEE